MHVHGYCKCAEENADEMASHPSVAFPAPLAQRLCNVSVIISAVPCKPRVVYVCVQVVDDFLKVPGAKVFNVMKHKVTFHDVDATPEPPSSSPQDTTETTGLKPEDKDDNATTAAAAGVAGAAKDDPDGQDDGAEEETAGDKEAAANNNNNNNSGNSSNGDDNDDDNGDDDNGGDDMEKKKVRVRAVTELERVVFLSRERILLLACPSGPTRPGLVKSNHHLTELQKMTFMRRDPTLVTLHYLAPERPLEEEDGEAQEEGVGVGGGGGGGVSSSSPVDEAAAAAAAAAMKRNVYRFGLDDKEAFIRIIRGALQRFQA